MSVYFIHAEVLGGGEVAAKMSLVMAASNAVHAFQAFMADENAARFQSQGFDIVIDKLKGGVMALFWLFWIPLNFMFWLAMAAGVNEPRWIHFIVGSFLAVVTGVVPCLLYQYFK